MMILIIVTLVLLSLDGTLERKIGLGHSVNGSRRVGPNLLSGLF
jgi:hypothetical protein